MFRTIATCGSGFRWAFLIETDSIVVVPVLCIIKTKVLNVWKLIWFVEPAVDVLAPWTFPIEGDRLLILSAELSSEPEPPASSASDSYSSLSSSFSSKRCSSITSSFVFISNSISATIGSRSFHITNSTRIHFVVPMLFILNQKDFEMSSHVNNRRCK